MGGNVSWCSESEDGSLLRTSTSMSSRDPHSNLPNSEKNLDRVDVERMFPLVGGSVSTSGFNSSLGL